ncbi:MAG: preprotein translocase YidC [Ignavibacteria bacterium CG2_30_36_16]|nr:MAG: preprotein translocase YidC [Ignavibacteria bacterium CG2_30_36_16]PJB00989.1 MAG: preprotein translocase YidC [Ignavibacteria bacterium CG_4_9_14_3_um_filter_36_18]
MDKQTTIGFILIGAILIFWLYFNAPEPPKEQPVSKDTTALASVDSSALEKKEIIEQGTMVAADSTIMGKYFSSSTEEEKIINIETELSKIEFSTRGGSLRKLFLKKYNNWYSLGEEEASFKNMVQLINYNEGGSYNIDFVSGDGKAINTESLSFKSNLEKSYYRISKEDSLTISFTYTSIENKQIKKNYTIYGDKYGMNSEIELINMGGLISNNTFDLVWGNGLRFVEKNSVDEANYSNASVYYGDEQVIIDASNPEKIQENFNGRVEWMAVRNKYFAAVVVPKDPADVEGAYIEGFRKMFPGGGMREYYSTRLTVPFKNTPKEKKSFLLYVGPVDYDLMESYGHNLVKLVDFGSFFGLKFVVRPIAEYVLLPLFNFLHKFIPNYGFVIILFSLIIKFVLYPLTKTSYQSMKKMQLLQPKIAELKEKYKDDAQKMNQETMKLYSTYGINPAGGCLPLLLQMPIFIALWGLFQSVIELRQQPFILWITDLSAPDTIINLGFNIPLFGISTISGLALLMGVTTFIQQKQSVKDPKQQALVYVMPVMLTLLFMSFPSGLNLYYFMFNLFTIIQQYYINHTHKDLELVPVKEGKQKKGFMQRMMQAAEQNAKTQKQHQRKNK